MGSMDRIAVQLFKEMLRIRIIEERIADIYHLGEMRTPTHFSIGQEAVSAGVCQALNDGDAVFASHRCHAAYLARGGDLKGMVAELYGRITGVCGGKSGSAHLSSPKGNMYAAPILGAMIPVAVGAALSFSMNRKKNASIVFFGDAAVEEGVFSESINFSVVKKLPVFFVCENNLFCTHIHIRYRQPDIPIYKRVKGLGIETKRVDGNDALEVYRTARDTIGKIRRGQGPVFIEYVTYRWREHVGPNFDYDNPYRTKAQVESWMRRCPVKRLKNYLLEKNVITDRKIAVFEREINREIDEAIRFARRSPWPGKADLLKDVY